MKTPYDTAMRIAERRLDALRAAIGLAVDDLQRIETAHCAIDAAMAREGALATTDPNLTTEIYFQHARDQRTRLAADRATAQARLEGLRLKAVEHYGSRTAIATAVSGFHVDADRAAAAAEQAAIDDLTGSRHRRTRRADLGAEAGSPP